MLECAKAVGERQKYTHGKEKRRVAEAPYLARKI
jgi:hypothetical protein